MTLQLTTAIDRRGWRASYAKAYRRSRTYKRARARKVRDAFLFLMLVLVAIATAAFQGAMFPPT